MIDQHGFLRIMLAISVCLATPAHANSVSEQWLRALTQDSRMTLHLRSHYLSRDKANDTDSLAWAGGGWLSYRSAWLSDQVQVGLTAYTSQPLYAPADKDGTSLLMHGQQPYTLMGESFLSYRYRDSQTITAGRFVMNQFEINPQDTRMTPRVFEGLWWRHQDEQREVNLVLIDKMKARHWDYFEPVAKVAGAIDGIQQPLWAVSFRNQIRPNVSIGLSHYRLEHLFQSSYSDLIWRFPLIPSGDEFRLSAQWMKQSSIGQQQLIDGSFDTWSAGLKGEWKQGPLTLGVARLYTDQQAAYRVPFGSWIGYASRIITNFNRAGEQVWALDALLQWDRLGVPGLSMHASVTWGDEAVVGSRHISLPNQREIDLTIEYRFGSGDWPNWLKPLCVRVRSGHLAQGDRVLTTHTQEQHIIFNYALPIY